MPPPVLEQDLEMELIVESPTKRRKTGDHESLAIEARRLGLLESNKSEPVASSAKTTHPVLVGPGDTG